MKKIFLSALLMMGFYKSAMGDSKLPALSEDTTPASTDILYEAKDPSGSALSRKVQIGNVFATGRASTGTWSASQNFTSAVSSTFTGIVDTGLSNSLPVQTDSNKQLISSAINLSGSQVTGSLPAASVAAGSLGPSVLVSSLTKVVAAGSCTNCNATFNDQGQVTTFTNGSAGGGGLPLYPGDTNYIQMRATLQTGATYYVSSGTVANNLTAGTFTGNGAALTSLTPGNLSAGSLPSTVLASSFPVTAVTAGSYTNTNLTVDAYGRLTSASNGSAGSGGLPLYPGDTNYIQVKSTLQTGSTFYVSTGTVLNLNASSVTIGSPISLALPANPLSVGGNSNGPVQVNVQNLSSGTLASSDYIATGDLGTNTSFYLDMGINSSTNSDSSFSVARGSDSYVYAQNRSLVIGTAENLAGSSLKFFTGGSSTGNVRMSIDNTGIVSINGLGAGPLKTIATSSNVVNAAIWLSSATDVGGTLQAAQFPALTGQVTTTAGSLATVLSAVSLSTGVTGTLAAAQFPALTGQVTTTAGSLVTTLVAVSLSTGVTGSLPASSLTGAVALASIPNGNTNYIQMTASLQTGATFFVSSGTVNSQLSVNGTMTASSVTVRASNAGVSMVVLNSTGSAAITLDTTLAALTTSFQVLDSTGRAVFVIQGSGHLISQSTQPVLSSCGTSPTMSSNSNDFMGTVTVGATASGCTVTFGNSYPNAPTCIVTERTMSLTNALAYTTSTTALTLTETTFGGVIFDYLCGGH